MFNRKNIKHYLLAASLILIASYVGTYFKNNYIENNNAEYDMIKEYLLNESPLYGFNKTKIWIHSKYELNARKWLDFQSRNTNNLNQPYINLTIQSVIEHCSNDFHICLIDDHTFSKLIPGWDININEIAEPKKGHYRDIAMLKLLYIYGGMIVPDSFVCLKSLKQLYDKGTISSNPFMLEGINKTTSMNETKRKIFTPQTYFMGANKNDPIIELLIECLLKNTNNHFSQENMFSNYFSDLCSLNINNGKMNIIDGKLIGVKSIDGSPILIEDLVEEKFLDLDNNVFGIYIPRDEILKRNNYNWFANLSTMEILESNMAISKYIKESKVNNSLNVTANTDV